MRARVLTALALIPPVLAAIFSTSAWPLVALLIVILILGAAEIHRLTNQVLALFGIPFLPALAAAIVIPFYDARSPSWNQYLATAIAGGAMLVIAIVAMIMVSPTNRRSNPLALLFGGWVTGPLAALWALHQSPQVAETWYFSSPVLLAVLPLWAGDTAAIFAGKAFGKHKLAPTISPKKTVEGGIANLIACIFAAWGFGALIGIPAAPALACGFAAGILGQAGDLFESWMKRRVDLKDSGTLLPGHGGILDRIDSILFTAPAVAIILLLWPK